MLISAVICTHNRCRLLEQTLDSLRGVIVPPGAAWEVWVIDNNSSDGTRAMVEARIQRDATFPLRYRHEHRQGIAFARNAGVEAAQGDIIAFVDDDVLVRPSWLEIVYRSFLEDPSLAVLGGRVDPNPESPMPEWLTTVNTAPLGLIDYGPSRRDLSIPYLATANCAFRRESILAAGGFDVRLGRRPDKLYADEDTDMVARIQASGGRVVYEPEMAARHFVPNHRMTKDYFRRWYAEKGEGAGLVGVRSGRTLLGIAYFDYRHLLVGLAGYGHDLLRGRPRFQHELAIRYFAGLVRGRLKATLPRK